MSSVASAAQQAAPLSGAESDALLGLAALGKTGFALILVIGLILACTWLLRRLTNGAVRNGQHLKVIGSTPLGQRERITIVEVGGTWLVLGVTAEQISKLHELPAPASPEPQPSASRETTAGSRFAERLSQALKHNLRREQTAPTSPHES